jgi:glucan phosphoethanolaminetransferase (alkaline phosphatase superfamily)
MTNKQMPKLNNFLFVYIFFILIFLCIERFSIATEVYLFLTTNAPLYKPLIYAFTYLICVLSITSFLFIKNKRISYFLILLISILMSLNTVQQITTESAFGYEEILILLNNVAASREKDFVENFTKSLILFFIITTTLLSLFILIKTKLVKVYIQNYIIISLCVVSCFLTYGIIQNSNAVRQSFPSPQKIAMLFSYAHNNRLYMGERESIYMEKTKPMFDHIIYIVDESMRGDLMQINGYHIENNPFLDSIKNKIVNLGVIPSTCVCSDYSNIALISGLRENEIPDKKSLSRKKPTIFQYASQNGYITSYLYPQGQKNVPDGFMTKYDDKVLHNKINIKQNYPNITSPYLDFKSLDIIDSIMNNHKKTFTYLIKHGAHFHYENCYPENYTYFKPTLNKNNWTQKDKEKLYNSYFNAMRWSVDRFFKTIFEKFKEKNILIVYTSDHGQNIMDDLSTELTHCAKGKAHKSMAKVPLFLTSTDSTYMSILKNNIPKENYNMGSHFEIFPTLLNFMGYKRSVVEKQYGYSLFDTIPERKRRYYSGDLYGRGSFYANNFD